MTNATPRPPQHPDAPEVAIATMVPAAAGTATAVGVRVTHRGRIPARMRVTVLGLDSRWIPEPLELGPLQPGEAVEVTLTIVPERGALGARYPFAVAVEATPLRGSGDPVLGVAESTLAVDSAERISVSIQPPAPTAVFGKKFRVEITNPGSTDRPLQLLSDSATGASVRLRHTEVTVPAQRTVSVKGKVRIRRPTMMGGENVHAFSVMAQGTGAPEYAEATVRSRPLVRRGAWVAVGLVLVVALWAGLAIVFIPKISDAFKPKSLVGAPATVTSQGPVASPGGSGAGTSGAGSGAGEGTSGSGGSGGGSGGSGGGAGGSGSAGDEGGAAAEQAGYQLSGTVTGPGAKGTTVTLAPTSLASASEVDAKPAPGTDSDTVSALRSTSTGPLGKVYSQALEPAGDSDTSIPPIVTGEKGTFQFAGVTAPGYYLLTLSHQGFQTQRFLINSSDLASPKPLKVALVPGAGSLSGVVTGSGEGIPAATITITDGTSTLQTSSVSTATDDHPRGSWSVNHLSTPADYLITASAPGFGSAAMLVHLDPEGTATADLNLKPGNGSIVGTISGKDNLGHSGGLGGITVTATNGDVTRTATTVTSQSLRGHYILPNLPVPGQYTLTISGTGFLTQTRKVEFADDVVSATVDATLTRGDAVVSGTVTGQDAHGASQGGLVGVGLTLVSSTATLKTMTTSGAKAGSYRFTGVPPGTYVLTASQYGRSTATSTIELKPADNTTVDLTLRADSGSELPTDAHIRGQVVDSRTGGPLTCDRTAVPIKPGKCVATVTVSAPADPAGSSQKTITYSTTTTDALEFLYTVPSLDDPKHSGLPPGLYTVTVSAPGYETSTTHVQVAQGQTAPAPTVSLPALGIISGTITTRVGTPSAPSCVIAVPASTTVPDSAQTSCQPNKTGTACQVPGIGSAACGLTSEGSSGQGAAGTYQIRGLTHGRYQILVIAQDPEYRYVVGTPPIVEIDVGGDGQFNAVLDRLGRVQLTVLSADRKSGSLAPTTDATVTIAKRPSGKPRAAGTITSKDNGTLTITGLNGSYEVTATSDGTSASGRSDPVGLNQTVALTLVIAAPVGPLVGRITTTGMKNQPIALAGAQVTITGTVGYDNGTARPGSAVVTTDKNGCYAVLPRGWTADAVPLTSSVCPDVVDEVTYMTDNESGARTTLTTDRIQIAVAAQSGVTQAHPADDETISGTGVVRVIPTVNVTPEPVPVGPLTLTIQGPASGYSAPDLSHAEILVLNKPGLAGGVTIEADPTTANPDQQTDVTTTLQFADTKLPVPPGSPVRAMPGRYPLTVTLDGFVSARKDLLCHLGATSCSLVDPGDSGTGVTDLVLKRRPDIAVTVDAPVLPSGPPNWDGGTVTLDSGANLGNLALRMDPNNPQVGHVTFNGSLSQLANAGGVYKFSIEVEGYATTSGTVRCGADFTDPCRATITLATLPVFPRSLVTLSDTSALPGNHTFSAGSVTATISPNPGATISVDVQQDSASGPFLVKWTDSSPGMLAGQVAPVDGGYTIVYHLAGFSDVTATLTCANGTCTQSPANITMKLLPIAGGAVQLPLAAGAATVDLSGAMVTVDSPAAAQQTLTVSLSQPSVDSAAGTATASLQWDQTPTVPYAGLVQPGIYTITISVPGYYPKTVSSIDCTFSDDVLNRVCTFPDSSTIAMTLYPQPAMGVTILPPAGVPGLTVSAPAGVPKVTLLSDASGGLTWTQIGQPTGVVAPGVYTIRVATLPGPGYQMLVDNAPDDADHTLALSSDRTATFTCTSSSACVFPYVVLTAPTTLTIELQDANEQPAGHADLTLDRTGGSPGSGSSPEAVNGTASFPSRSTSKVPWQYDQTAPSYLDGSYTLAVRADGFAFADGSDAAHPLLTSSSPNVQCSNGSVTVTGLQLFPGGETTCVVTLTRLGTITGTTWWARYDLAGGLLGTTVQSGVDVTATLLNDDDAKTGTHFSATSDANGHYTLTGTSDIDKEGLTEGTWLIEASHTGMDDITGVVSITSVDGGQTYHLAAATDYTGTYPKLEVDDNAGTQTLPLVFTPSPVDLHLRLRAGSPLADLSAPVGTTVTLTDSAPTPYTTTPHTRTCTVAADPDSDTNPPVVTGCELVQDDDTDQIYLNFTDLPPSDYTATVTFAPNTYNEISEQPISLEATGDAQQVKLRLAAQVSTVAGGFIDSTYMPITSFPDEHPATVQLCPWTATSLDNCAANDFSGTPMTDDAVTGSSFQFTNVPNGDYKAVVTADGYAGYSQSGFLHVQYGTAPPNATVQMSAATRAVSLTLTSLSQTDTALDLTGATIVLQPQSSPHEPPNEDLQIAVNQSGAVDLGRVPTGTWSVIVQDLPGSPFPVPASDDLTVTDPPLDDINSVQEEKLSLNQAEATFTFTWSDTDCVTSPAPPSTITLPLTQQGSTPVPGSVTVPVGDDDSATVTVNLPPGTYAVDTDKLILPTGWKLDGTPDNTEIVDPAASPDDPTDIALTAVTTPVSVQLMVNGSAAADSVGAKITATCSAGGDDEYEADDGTITLPPGTWDFAIAGTKNAYPIKMQGKSSITITDGNNDPVTFEGYSLQPSVQQQDVPGLSTSVSADVAITRGTETVWSKDDVTVGAAGWPSSTISVIVDGGTYGLSADTGSSTVFGDGSATPVTVGTGTTAASTLQATLPYLANGATITVNDSGGDGVDGATVSLTTADGGDVTCNSPSTTGDDGTISCVGLNATTTYAVDATWADDDGSYAAYGTLTTGAAGDTSASTVLTLQDAPAALVTITDANGDPVPGATVTLYTSGGAATGITRTTDGLGRALLPELEANTTYYALATATVTMTDPDTSDEIEVDQSSPEIKIQTGGRTITDAAGQLADTVSLTVTVQDSTDDSPIENATVTISSNQHKILLGTDDTDASGTVSFDDLPPVGKVTISAKAAGYGDKTLSGVGIPATTDPVISLAPE